MITFQQLILEGGMGGHMSHPYDISGTGKELVSRFEEAVKLIKAGRASVKIDGINTSVRVVNEQFVMDRGTSKGLDIKGIRPEDLEARFGAGHGLVDKGTKILRILDEAFPVIKSELKSLGMLTNPNILLNIEYVEGQTNVIEYKNGSSFLAIHGLKIIKDFNFNKKTGILQSRRTSLAPYDENVMNRLVSKLNDVAKKFGFVVIGKVAVKLTKQPNFTPILKQKLELNNETKTLKDWLMKADINLPLITRREFLEIQAGDKSSLTETQLNGYLTYLATIQLGDEILRNATSPLGPLSEQEGVVVKRNDNSVFKITGSFILKGLSSPFERNA